MRWTRTPVETGADPARPDPGLRIDPVAVGRGRSSGGLVVAAAIAVAVAIAIAKPWASPVPPVAGLPSHPVAVAPSTSPRASAIDVARATAAPGRTRIESAVRAVRVTDWPRLAADVDHLAGQPIVTDRDLGGTDGDGTCGGSARITPFDELIGVVTPPGVRIADVRLFAIDSIRRPDIPVRITPDRPGPLDGRALDGLTLVALPSGGIAAREYALIADTVGSAGAGERIYTVCVG